MTIARRKILGLFAAGGAASTLAACGGGGDVYVDGGYVPPPPARSMWLLNLNPEFASSDVSFGAANVSSALQFPGITTAFVAEYGSYTLSIRKANGVSQDFPGVGVDANSPSMFVFYRRFASTRLDRKSVV